ncbi:hypothetical protein E2C01_012987 [Portunus trituberculatus]|uniref:Uncharacterized protein n=1 Tax=Portunus trituberculatus TaxID=210409 RepID=A0A5B7DFR5_PORTR|nr:hypothetical protein [Portunus trituberculatus]
MINTITRTDTLLYQAVSLLIMAAIGATLTPVRLTTKSGGGGNKAPRRPSQEHIPGRQIEAS